MATQNAVNDIYVPLSGGTMTGLLVLSGDPVTALGAVTKQYADAIAAGIDFKDATVAATTATLNATYLNGVSGVGATLTNAGSLAAFSIDGISPAINSRILVKNQSSTFQNGIYTLGTVGSGAVAWILIRSTDYDQAPSEIFPGTLVPVISGTVNADTSWIEVSTVNTIGTDPITFSQFSTAPLTLPLTVAQGGTGVATLTTAYGPLVAGTTATNPVQTISPSATALPLVSGGTSAIPSYAVLTVPGGGTGVATLTTAYGILAAGTTATGAVQTISPGSSTQVLTSNGNAALATFQAAAAAGALTWIGSVTSASTATFNFSKLLSTTYDNYIVLIENVITITTNATFEIILGFGATPTYANSGYQGSVMSASTTTVAAASNGTTGIYPAANIKSSATYNLGGYIIINGANSTTSCNVTGSVIYQNTTPAFITAVFGSAYSGGNAINSLEFLMSTGNIGGTIKLYGYQN